MKRLLFGPLDTGSRDIDCGLLILRVIGGMSLALGHGIGKIPPSEGFTARISGMGFALPELFAWVVAFTEFAGGIALALGLLTRSMAAVIAIIFLVVTFIAHAGDPFGDREKPILFLMLGLTLALTGAGRFSLDSLIARRDARTES